MKLCQMSESQPSSTSNRRRSHGQDEETTLGIRIRCGDAPREDSFPIPQADWRWGEGTAFVLMADYALAASNAVNAIFLPIATTVIIGMCSIHAWNQWADNHHRADFKDYKKIAARWVVTLKNTRECHTPFLSYLHVV
jgi:hypothetical protein